MDAGSGYYGWARGDAVSLRWLALYEEERQVLLLALAHLAVERPGWDDMLNRMATRIDNEQDGRAVTYDEFCRLHVGREPPVGVFPPTVPAAQTIDGISIPDEESRS